MKIWEGIRPEPDLWEVVKKSGPGTGRHAIFSAIRQGWPEPVPIFSQSLASASCPLIPES